MRRTYSIIIICLLFFVLLYIDIFVYPLVTLSKLNEKPPYDRLVIIKKIDVYTKPDIKSKKANFKLSRGDILHIVKVIITQDSYDWGGFIKDDILYYVPLQYLSHIPKRIEGGDIPIGEEIVDINNPLPYDYVPSDLVELPKSIKLSNKEIKLRKEAAIWFEKFIMDAKEAGYNLKIVSAFRSAEYQERLYLSSISRNGPKQNSSAKPGYSEHQLGTTCDISSDEVNWKLTTKLYNTKAYKWISQNARSYGLYISYPKDSYQQTGYTWEPWHLRYKGIKK